MAYFTREAGTARTPSTYLHEGVAEGKEDVVVGGVRHQHFHGDGVEN